MFGNRRGDYDTQSSDYKSTNGRCTAEVTAPDGVVSVDTLNGLPSDCQSCETDNSKGNQGLTKVQSRRETNYKEQSMMLHQSRFELEDDNNTQLKSESMVVKEILDKIRLGRQRINLTLYYTEQGTTTHARSTKLSSQGLPKGSIKCQEVRKEPFKDIKASGNQREIQFHDSSSSQILYTDKQF
jgi:hypothetical protein